MCWQVLPDVDQALGPKSANIGRLCPDSAKFAGRFGQTLSQTWRDVDLHTDREMHMPYVCQAGVTYLPYRVDARPPKEASPSPADGE